MTQFGYDGQVGCAAITFKAGSPPDGPTDAEMTSLQGLEGYLTQIAGLANYAVPRFVRVLVDISDEEKANRDQLGVSDSVGSEYTSFIMKKLKTGLRKEGT